MRLRLWSKTMHKPRQEQTLEIIKRKDKQTAAEIAKQMDMEAKAIGVHLRSLEHAGLIYVSEWKKGKHNVMTKCYTAGVGESVEYVSQKTKPKKQRVPKEPVEDANVYQIKNNSRIIDHDPRMHHAEHIRFMNSFKPHADHASVWMFNEPKVELQGNKHDLL